jgi:hypothetical protein
MKTISSLNMSKYITVINWSDGSCNKFNKGDENIQDFIAWKKQKNPNLRITCRYNIKRELATA